MSMSRERAERIVSAILSNLGDRSGIGDALDAIPKDTDDWEDMAESLVDSVLAAEKDPRG